MNGLLQISDTHFGTERAEVVRALVALVRERAPRLVVLSGDITQRATRVQFAAARRFVDALEAPACLAIPGNHDIPLFDVASRLLRPYARYSAAFGTGLEPVYEDAELRVVGVKTTRRWRHKHGNVSPTQVARAACRIAGAGPGQLRVVVTHQPVAVTRAEDEENRLRGGDLAVRIWSAAGCDLVLGGHIHLPYCVDLQAPLGLDRPVWAVQAGTAVSRRLRAGTDNSINEIDWQFDAGGRRAILTRWDWSPSEAAFRVAVRSSLALGS